LRIEHERIRRRGPLGRAAVRAAVALAVLATASPAAADVAPPATLEQGQGYVNLVVAADAESAAALEGTLRELVARLGLTLRVTRTDSAPAWVMAAAPRDPGERARVSVDETPGDHVLVVVSVIRAGEPPSPPVERSIPRAESSAILTEQVAHVVHATLESLLVGDGPAPQPPPARQPPTASNEAPADHVPATPPGRRDGFSLDAAVFATGRGVSSGSGAVPGVGAALHATAWRGFGRPSLWLSGSYNAPFDESSKDLVVVQTTVSSFRAVPSLQVVIRRWLDVDAGVGAGVDVFHTDPSDPGPNVTLRPTKNLVDPILTAQIIARFRIAASARVFVGVDLDYDAGAHRYVTADASGTPTQVFQPWPLRPSAMVGLCVPLLGTLGCGGAE
jgi:hypothetical protein